MNKAKNILSVGFLFFFFVVFSSFSGVFGQEAESIDSNSEDSNTDDLQELDMPFLSSEGEESSLAVSLAELEASGSALHLSGFSSLGLPEITILPDSPLYRIKLLWEKIVLFFTLSPEKKAKVTLAGAEKRLAEAYRMIEEKQLGKAEEALKKYEELIQEVTRMLPDLKDIDPTLLNKIVRKIEATTIKQHSVITYYQNKNGTVAGAYDEVSDMKVTAVERAIETLVETNTATPSYELKQKIKEILESDEYDEETKNRIETKLNERLRREILKEDPWQQSN